MPTFLFTLAFLNDENKILKGVRSTLRHTSLTIPWESYVKDLDSTVNLPVLFIYSLWL